MISAILSRTVSLLFICHVVPSTFYVVAFTPLNPCLGTKHNDDHHSMHVTSHLSTYSRKIMTSMTGTKLPTNRACASSFRRLFFGSMWRTGNTRRCTSFPVLEAMDLADEGNETAASSPGSIGIRDTSAQDLTLLSASAPEGMQQETAEVRSRSHWTPRVFFRAIGGLLRRVTEVPESATDEATFLMMAAFVGVVTGTAVTIFKLLIGLVKDITYGNIVGRFPASASGTVSAFVPVIGALAVVSIMKLLRLKSYGPGLGGLTEEVDKQVPWIPKRTLGKTLAAVATLGTGNSLGPEGPAVELGVAASRCASSLSNLSVERQRMLLGAGAAGGVAAGFNAPIAGIFFALEIVKDTFETRFNSKSFIAGTLLCAVVSALIAKIGLHDELSLRPAAYFLESPLIELPLYLGLGIIAGLVAVMFKFFSRKSAEVFEGKFPGFGWMRRVPQWTKPTMMAAVTGLVGIASPQVLFFGYETLDRLLANTGQYSVRFLCLLCVSKAMLTAGALGSGLVGGTFAPSLFLGATAGAAYQKIIMGGLNALRTTAAPAISDMSAVLYPVSSFLGIGGPTGDLSTILRIAGSPAYAMVGAAAVLSALYRAPLTGSLLLFELTKDYDIVLPLMAAAGVSSLLVEVFSRTENEVSAKETTAAMPRDMSLEIGLRVSGEADILMSKVKVVDALMPQVLTLTAGVPLDEAMRAFRFTRSDFAIVVEPARETGATHEAMSNIQTFSAEELWGRKDLHLVGVLALREISLAMERGKREGGDGVPIVEDLTAGGICRKDFFAVKATADIASAKGMMGSKGVRFLPVVTDESQDRKGGEVVLEEGVSDLSTAEAVPLKEEEHAAENDTTEGPSGAQVVVGVLSRESVRIAGRLTETERAVQDMSKASTVTT